MPGEERQAVEFQGRRLVLTNIGKVLYPATGTTKAAALDYYVRVAPRMVPHTAGRPASFVRAPEGPGGQRWYAKNPPPGLPEWAPVAEIPSSDGPAPHVVVDDAATLVAMANLGAWEIHVPQWTVAAGPDGHDRLVLDLDPGPGAGLPECCRIALLLRTELGEDGLTALPVVSGSKGLHLYVALHPASEDAVRGYARRLATRIAGRAPRAATATMAKAARAGRVFIDWSQNASAKTTAAPYTLRLLDEPSVAAPVTWEEVAACRDPADLRFAPDAVLERLARDGDLLAAAPPPAALP